MDASWCYEQVGIYRDITVTCMSTADSDNDVDVTMIMTSPPSPVSVYDVINWYANPNACSRTTGIGGGRDFCLAKSTDDSLQTNVIIMTNVHGSGWTFLIIYQYKLMSIYVNKLPSRKIVGTKHILELRFVRSPFWTGLLVYFENSIFKICRLH